MFEIKMKSFIGPDRECLREDLAGVFFDCLLKIWHIAIEHPESVKLGYRAAVVLSVFLVPSFDLDWICSGQLGPVLEESDFLTWRDWNYRDMPRHKRQSNVPETTCNRSVAYCTWLVYI